MGPLEILHKKEKAGIIADQYIYWAVNIGSISIPLLFSFHPKLRFDREWKYVWPAILSVGFVFVLWDVYFTGLGVWGFNNRYLTGGRVWGLPYEEIAFFICIPYACLFTYHCFGVFWRDRFQRKPWIVQWLIPVVCFLFLLTGWEGYYTRWTGLGLLFFYMIHILILRSSYLNLFLFSYALLLIPFLITNGILTGTGIEEEVVWYNPDHHLGLRVGTIPVEDVFYGMLLVLINVTIWEKMKARRLREKR